MDPELRLDERLAAALFRTLAAQQGFPAAGLLLLRDGACRLVAETPALAALVRGCPAAGWPAPDAGRCGRAERIDPASLSLAAGFAAVAPVAERG